MGAARLQGTLLPDSLTQQESRSATMTFVTAYLTGRMGDAIDDVSSESIARVLAELDEPEDPEHPDVWISSEWILSATQSGRLIWENDETGEGPHHMGPVPRETVSALFHAVANDDLQTVHAQAWLPGYQ
jgi:hypothetical protein